MVLQCAVRPEQHGVDNMARTAKQIEDRKRNSLRQLSLDSQMKEAENVREAALLNDEDFSSAKFRKEEGVRDVLKGGSVLRRRMANVREDAKRSNLSEKDTQRRLKRTTLLHNVLERNPIGELKPKAAKPKGAKPKKAPARKVKAKKAYVKEALLRKPKAKNLKRPEPKIKYKKGGLVKKKGIDGIAMRGKTKATRSR